MEFWLISSENLEVGLRTEMVRPGFDRVSGWGIKMTRAIWELANPAFKVVFYGTFEKAVTPKKPNYKPNLTKIA